MGSRHWIMSKGLGCLLVLLSCFAAHAGTVTYVYTDAQGTPVMETDAQGNITARFDYAPYGSIAMGTAPNGPGYTGHVNDPDTGLVYMQARYYDPVTARFLSVDPKAPVAGNAFNFNRYSYANNNPVVNIDPDGRETGIAYHSEFVAMGGKQQNYISPNDKVGPALRAAFNLLPVVGDGVNIGNAFANPSAVTISAAVVGALPVVGGAAADAVKGASAFERAGAIAGTMSARTQRSVTIAVTETQEGVRVVSSSEATLRPAALAALGDGEVAARGITGAHAEANGINAARGMGLTPTGTAASRPICAGCAQILEQHAVVPLSPLKTQ
ncbi:MAG: RHS repeat-associated core domain-containing protein [Rhodanobacter sp.]